MKTPFPVSRLLLAALLGLGAMSAQSAVVTVVNNLPDGSDLIVTDLTSNFIQDNTLVTPGGYNFSGKLSQHPTSTKGWWYAEYLVDVTTTQAESVTTALTNKTGITQLSERIYNYVPGAADYSGFLGDAVAGPALLQAWSTNFPIPGATVSVISPVALTTGKYVIELRGKVANPTLGGNYGGTLSLTPIPEPEALGLLALGLGVVGVRVFRNRGQM